ncbi:MAG TPA: pitrilysin family protein [Methylomirabilota bacterium]|nr:pitrilysin family protein [Methylomirabilota bacterium]
MTALKKCSLLLILLVINFPAALFAQSIHIPPHEKVVFKNGLTVLLLEKRGVPIVNFAALVKTGGAADPPGQEGLASVTAQLLRKGTQKRTAQQFAADSDFTGGSVEADASADFSTVAGEFLNKDLARGLDLFSDALLHPIFPQAEVDKLLAQSLDGVRAAKDEVRSVLGTYYDAYLFNGNGYGRTSDGDEISLTKIRGDAIVKFYETYYAPGNIILAVAGDFQTADMKKKLEEVFGQWPSKPVTPVKIPVLPPVKGKKLLLVDKPDATQTYFAIGNVATAAGDPDRVAVRLVNTVFGGRFTSLLNEALRVESGLTYGAISAFDPRKAPGPFGIYSYTKNESTVQAIDMALQVLQKLHKQGITGDELASAKSYIKGQFPPSLETSKQLAQIIAINEFYGLDDREINDLEARLDAVTPAIAQQVIQKHFPTDNLVFTLIGKRSDIAAGVQKYAEKQDARVLSEPGFWPPPAQK